MAHCSTSTKVPKSYYLVKVSVPANLTTQINRYLVIPLCGINRLINSTSNSRIVDNMELFSFLETQVILCAGFIVIKSYEECDTSSCTHTCMHAYRVFFSKGINTTSHTCDIIKQLQKITPQHTHTLLYAPVMAVGRDELRLDEKPEDIGF